MFKIIFLQKNKYTFFLFGIQIFRFIIGIGASLDDVYLYGSIGLILEAE